MTRLLWLNWMKGGRMFASGYFIWCKPKIHLQVIVNSTQSITLCLISLLPFFSPFCCIHKLLSEAFVPLIPLFFNIIHFCPKAVLSSALSVTFNLLHKRQTFEKLVGWIYLDIWYFIVSQDYQQINIFCVILATLPLLQQL